MTEFRVLDEGRRCEVDLDGGRTFKLTAQPGTIYTEADAERIIAATEKYLQGNEHTTDEQIRVHHWFGREWIVRIDHSPPAWKWPKVLVNRKHRWIGVGWRMTLVQVYGPRRAS